MLSVQARVRIVVRIRICIPSFHILTFDYTPRARAHALARPHKPRLVVHSTVALCFLGYCNGYSTTPSSPPSAVHTLRPPFPVARSRPRRRSLVGHRHVSSPPARARKIRPLLASAPRTDTRGAGPHKSARARTLPPRPIAQWQWWWVRRVCTICIPSCTCTCAQCRIICASRLSRLRRVHTLHKYIALALAS